MAFTIYELEAFLDEALPADEMAHIEEALRNDAKLLAQLSEVQARRDASGHSLGAIWRQERLTCISRDQLGALLLGTLADDLLAYAQFHLETIGCRWCEANLADLREQQSAQQTSQTRQRRYFQSSAEYLKRPG